MERAISISILQIWICPVLQKLSGDLIVVAVVGAVVADANCVNAVVAAVVIAECVDVALMPRMVLVPVVVLWWLQVQ